MAETGKPKKKDSFFKRVSSTFRASPTVTGDCCDLSYNLSPPPHTPSHPAVLTCQWPTTHGYHPQSFSAALVFEELDYNAVFQVQELQVSDGDGRRSKLRGHSGDCNFARS